ncbi:alpha/beta fold hydrolase [Helicobacter sp. MIT 14-3879]|uniref:alpha/beta fold hydrolase n=1 Tax=Helicobacter sp. MIT 14-3879 TaxID=2040649 RepID=UPI000E1F4257|nr:alpha/beta fold hydrolase [Helicobacter sp. MIT 14-3879]RDU61366.1 alpha/beta hydrolase [Helicobacter sp. MIT 14-3879]
MSNTVHITKDIQLDSNFGFVFWDLYEPPQSHTQSLAPHIIQIAHGMVEHKERYKWVCTFLAESGFIVAISDHRGHGKSISSYCKGKDSPINANLTKEDSNNEDLIYWGEMGQDGINLAVQDLYALNCELHSRFQDSKIILLGHSMGSLISRLYLFKHASSICALILSGTPAPNPMINIAILLAKSLQFLGLEAQGANLLHKLSFGGFNVKLLKRLSKTETNKDNSSITTKDYTGFEWLCSDSHVVQAYISDPKCSFIFSLRSFLNLFTAVRDVYAIEKYADSLSKHLPILFISGDMDACGNFGDGVRDAKDRLNIQGYEHVTIKLYENARHEILNEPNKQEVLKDIIAWLDCVCESR